MNSVALRPCMFLRILRFGFPQEEHDKEHRTERQYFSDACYQGDTYPAHWTTVNIDAPTLHPFDIPFQRRKSRDAVKSLGGARKWQSKLTGAKAAGHGFFCYVARSALG
eukprot:3563831-Pleurochrysis_carterae.AAC.1